MRSLSASTSGMPIWWSNDQVYRSQICRLYKYPKAKTQGCTLWVYFCLHSVFQDYATTMLHPPSSFRTALYPRMCRAVWRASLCPVAYWYFCIACSLTPSSGDSRSRMDYYTHSYAMSSLLRIRAISSRFIRAAMHHTPFPYASTSTMLSKASITLLLSHIVLRTILVTATMIYRLLKRYYGASLWIEIRCVSRLYTTL